MDPSDASWVLVTTLTALDRELLWASQILQGYRLESEYADMSLLMSLLDFQTCRKAFSVFTLSNDRTSGSPPSRSPDECRPDAFFWIRLDWNHLEQRRSALYCPVSETSDLTYSNSWNQSEAARTPPRNQHRGQHSKSPFHFKATRKYTDTK